MSNDIARNKQLMRDAVATFNRGDLEGYMATYRDDAVIHGLPSEYGQSKREHAAYLRAVLNAFPGLQVEIDELIAEGPCVVARMTYRGTHVHDFRGIVAQGRTVSWTGIAIRRYDDEGRTIERYIANDTDGLRRQLEAA
jgi:steroid delta-isomerase-like uncharacterized protein